MAVRHAGKGDRADGMGSGFASRSDGVPDLMPRPIRGPAGTLVPTGANGVRERLGDGGWRLDRCGQPYLIFFP